MSRPHLQHVAPTPGSSRSTLVSALTRTDFADDDFPNEAVLGQPEARPDQSRASGGNLLGIEMHTMNHSPGEIPGSTHSGGYRRLNPKGQESLTYLREHNTPDGAASGPGTVGTASPPWMQRFGKTAIAVLILGTAVILSAVSFTGFLWFASFDNRTWHAIMIRDWLTESVTILAEVIKQAVNFQIGIGGAMLAALALERGEVSLGNAASMTMMRIGLGSGKLLTLSKKQFRRENAMGRSSSAIPYLIFLETIILTFIQFITIILASDIGLQPIPGYSKLSETAFGFTNTTSLSTKNPQSRIFEEQTSWKRKAAVYPTFAEYSEPPFIEDGVSDTGLTLRAFLPYSAAQSREDTHSYSGRTTVLDSRVTCQLPELEGETVQAEGEELLHLVGSVRATRATPRLGNLTVNPVMYANGTGFDESYNTSVPIFCVVPVGDGETEINSTNQWQTSLCQLGEGSTAEHAISGGLISEFKGNQIFPGPNDSPGISYSSNTYGTAYLMLNVTKGPGSTWSAVTDPVSIESGVKPPEYSTNGEWLDLIYSNGALVLSVTLCYSSFDTADLPVNISSNANRTESSPVFNFDTSMYTFDSLREQYGQYRDSMSLEQRGLLNLDKRDWVANQSEVAPGDVEPFMRDFANLGGPKGEGNDANYTATLWGGNGPDFTENGTSFQTLIPDQMHIWLFQEIVQSGGSVAFALQSLITLLASMAYYDQLGQFDNKAPISQTSFVTANTPLRSRGFIAVATVLFVHLIILAIIVSMFITGTRFSMLGNSWQILSQGVTSETERYLAVASTKTDDEVKKIMNDDGVENVRVHVDRIDGSDRVGVVRYDDGTIRRRAWRPNARP